METFYFDCVGPTTMPAADLLAEFDEGEELICRMCNQKISPEDEIFDIDGWCCSSCAEKWLKETKEEAAEFAVKNCKITCKLPRYKLGLEDVERGSR